MPLTNFIPQLWAGSILQNLQKSHVFGQAGVINRNYEGEIRDGGDRVNIPAIGAVNVINYTKNTDLGALQVMNDSTQQLLIDQQKAFNVFLDDIDAVQTNPKVRGEITREAAYALADVADTFLAAAMSAGVAAGNTIPVAAVTTPATAYERLVDLGVLLDEANVPSQDRWAIIPAWYEGMLLKDARFVASGAEAGDRRLQNGVIGRAAGFTILKSNNIPITGTPTDDYAVMAGSPMAVTFAEQIVKTEAIRNPNRFGDNLRGLHVYGARVIRPTALAKFIASRA